MNHSYIVHHNGKPRLAIETLGKGGSVVERDAHTLTIETEVDWYSMRQRFSEVGMVVGLHHSRMPAVPVEPRERKNC